MVLEGVPERPVEQKLVAIAPAFTGASQVTLGGEIAKDPLSRALGDADAVGDLANADARIPGDA